MLEDGLSNIEDVEGKVIFEVADCTYELSLGAVDRILGNYYARIRDKNFVQAYALLASEISEFSGCEIGVVSDPNEVQSRIKILLNFLLEVEGVVGKFRNNEARELLNSRDKKLQELNSDMVNQIQRLETGTTLMWLLNNVFTVDIKYYERGLANQELMDYANELHSFLAKIFNEVENEMKLEDPNEFKCASLLVGFDYFCREIETLKKEFYNQSYLKDYRDKIRHRHQLPHI